MCLSSACIAPFGLKEACVLFLQESWKHLNFGRFWFAQSNSEKTSAGQVDLADSNFHSHLSNTLTLADWFPMRPSWLLTVVLAWANEHSTDRRPFVYRAECLRKALKSAGLSCESWQIYQLARDFFCFFLAFRHNWKVMLCFWQVSIWLLLEREQERVRPMPSRKVWPRLSWVSPMQNELYLLWMISTFSLSSLWC